MGRESSRRHRSFAFLGALAATALSTLATGQTNGTTVAFVHTTVIDGTGSAARSDQTVLLSGDRITAVGPSRNLPVPRGARTIDATGRFLIPGLWDAHVHTRYQGIDQPRLLVANGITSARNMSGPWDYLPEFRTLREQIAKSERIGPRLLTAGPVLDGSNGASRSTNATVNNPEEGRQAVRRVKGDGADFVKVYNLLSRESYFAIAAEAKAQGLPFAGHLPFAIKAEEASDAGQLSIEHMDGLLMSASTQEDQIRKQLQDWRPRPGVPTIPVSATAYRDSFSVAKVRALAERFKKNQTSVVPTLSNYWNRFERRNEYSVVTARDRLRYVPAGYTEIWKGTQTVTSDEDERLLFEQCLILVRELHKGGVRILAGTDTGTAFQVPGFSLLDELSLLVKAGLSPMEALEAATRNPARAFNLTDQGTIETGMRADLVLLDSNPLENIDNIRKIRMVMTRGRLLDRNELDTMLSDIQRVASQWAGTPTR